MKKKKQNSEIDQFSVQGAEIFKTFEVKRDFEIQTENATCLLIYIFYIFCFFKQIKRKKINWHNTNIIDHTELNFFLFL